jgi:hypothetical protein
MTLSPGRHGLTPGAYGNDLSGKIVAEDQRKLSCPLEAQETPTVPLGALDVDGIDRRRLDPDQNLALSRSGHRGPSCLQLEGVRRSQAKQFRCGAHDHATPTPFVDWTSLISPR